MELTEDQNFEKQAKRCFYCTRDTILPSEYKWTCLSSGYNVTKRNNDNTKTQRKR